MTEKINEKLSSNSLSAVFAGLISAIIFSLFQQHHSLIKIRDKVDLLGTIVQSNHNELNRFKQLIKTIDDRSFITHDAQDVIRESLSKLGLKIESTVETVEILKPLTRLARDGDGKLTPETIVSKINQMPDKITKLEIMQKINLGNWRDLTNDLTNFKTQTNDNIDFLKRAIVKTKDTIEELDTKQLVMTLSKQGNSMSKKELNGLLSGSFTSQASYNSTVSDIKDAFKQVFAELNNLKSHTNFDAPLVQQKVQNSLLPSDHIPSETQSSSPSWTVNPNSNAPINTGSTSEIPIWQAESLQSLQNQNIQNIESQVKSVTNRVEVLEKNDIAKSKFLTNLNSWITKIDSTIKGS